MATPCGPHFGAGPAVCWGKAAHGSSAGAFKKAQLMVKTQPLFLCVGRNGPRRTSMSGSTELVYTSGRPRSFPTFIDHRRGAPREEKPPFFRMIPASTEKGNGTTEIEGPAPLVCRGESRISTNHEHIPSFETETVSPQPPFFLRFQKAPG